MPHVTPLRPDDPGHVGRYQLSGRIGGMPGTAPAYLGNRADGRPVTVSLLGSDWTHDSAARDRFAAEAAAAKRVQPICAARILDSGLDGDRAYLVREYIAGPSLLELVSAEGEQRGVELDALAIGMATGLMSVHQAGLVHGSFGPEHVIMSTAGPTVTEFGITPPYGMATPAADLLAWARTTLFAALARSPASMADLDILPEQLRQVVTDCLSPEPAERPLARSVVIDLLGGTEPAAGALAEGARRAGRASSAQARPAPGQPDWPGGHDSPPGQRAAPAPAEADQRSAPEHQRPGSGRTAAIVSVLAVILIAAGVIVIHRDQNAGGQHGKPGSAGKPALTAPASASSSPGPLSGQSASPAPTVPAALAGTWAGQVTQSSPADVFDVRLVLSAGPGTSSIAYSGTTFSCAGQLTLTSASGQALRLSQGIVQGQTTCANGVVTIAPTASGTLEFSFHGRSGPAASGTLVRQ